MADAKDNKQLTDAATRAKAWMKSIDDAQEAALSKILSADQQAKLKAFKTAAAPPTVAEIKTFVESIDSIQKAKVAKVFKPQQLVELLAIGRLLK